MCSIDSRGIVLRFGVRNSAAVAFKFEVEDVDPLLGEHAVTCVCN